MRLGSIPTVELIEELAYRAKYEGNVKDGSVYFSLNDKFTGTLTERGAELYNNYYSELGEKLRVPMCGYPVKNSGDEITLQFHEMIEIFHKTGGCGLLPIVNCKLKIN